MYINEIDKDMAHWLSCLPLRIDKIDTRSIKDVRREDVKRYTQCHFFGGIGGWPLALEIAKWPVDAPVWTGSCPCQPFSIAGKRKGVHDDRHLWPEFLRLIDECRPATVFGEQVASKDGRDWLSAVRADLEALGYAVGAADLCAAGVGAPHIRQRLFWVAHCDEYGRDQRREGVATKEHDGIDRDGASSRLADTGQQLSRPADPGQSDAAYRKSQERRPEEICESGGCGLDSEWLGDAKGIGRQQRWSESDGRNPSSAGIRVGHTNRQRQSAVRDISDWASTDAARGDWTDVDYITCRDGKARPVKPGIRLLAHGIPGRMAQLRGLGNAIVPQVAAEFVKSFMEIQIGFSL